MASGTQIRRLRHVASAATTSRNHFLSLSLSPLSIPAGRIPSSYSPLPRRLCLLLLGVLFCLATQVWRQSAEENVPTTQSARERQNRSRLLATPRPPERISIPLSIYNTLSSRPATILGKKFFGFGRKVNVECGVYQLGASLAGAYVTRRLYKEKMKEKMAVLLGDHEKERTTSGGGGGCFYLGRSGRPMSILALRKHRTLLPWSSSPP